MKKMNTETRKEQILNAALEIASGGINALNINAIAHRVGLVPSGIYRHFSNKDELVDSLLRFAGEKLARHFESLENRPISDREKLLSLLEHHIQFLNKNRGIPKIIFSEEALFGTPERRKLLLSIIQDYRLRIESFIERCSEEGLFQEHVKPGAVTYTMISLAQTTAMIGTLQGEGNHDPQAALEAWDKYCHLILKEKRGSQI